MLVLSRKIGESIRITPDIRVTLVEIRSKGSVKLGVEAPEHILVYREEIAVTIWGNFEIGVATDGSGK